MVRVTFFVELGLLVEQPVMASAAAPTIAIPAINFLLFNVFLFFEFCC
ncbi:MAG: hypothetical protein WDM88_11730 [Galbitalea sp.]